MKIKKISMELEKLTILHPNQSTVVQHAGKFFLIKSFDAIESIKYEKNYRTVFAFVSRGQVNFKSENLVCQLGAGTYLSASKKHDLEILTNSSGIIIETDHVEVLTCVGGPVESSGRLKYIDGCSDTLLISPARLGQPCLNLLHFPANTIQTMHHHPSFRFGIVISGSGISVSDSGEIPLKTGDVFYIPENYDHKFNTSEKEMNVIAFHPDSDWGPTDEIHPMKNRTWFKK